MLIGVHRLQQSSIGGWGKSIFWSGGNQSTCAYVSKEIGPLLLNQFRIRGGSFQKNPPRPMGRCSYMWGGTSRRLFTVTWRQESLNVYSTIRSRLEQRSAFVFDQKEGELFHLIVHMVSIRRDLNFTTSSVSVAKWLCTVSEHQASTPVDACGVFSASRRTRCSKGKGNA